MTPFDVRIGINPLSWMNDDLPSLGGETPLDVALTEGRQIGYQGFELGNKFPREPQALKTLLAQYETQVAARSATDGNAHGTPGNPDDKAHD